MSVVLSERVVKMHTTKTGVKIGLAYEAPPAKLSEDDEELQRLLMYEFCEDDEELQRALMYSRSERTFRLITWAMALGFCAVFWLLVWGAL